MSWLSGNTKKLKANISHVLKLVAVLAAIVFILFFSSELTTIRTSESILDNLLKIKPVIFIARATLIFLLLSIAGISISLLFRDISIKRIGKGGIEFVDIIEDSRQKIETKDKEILEYKKQIEKLKWEKEELQKILTDLLKMA